MASSAEKTGPLSLRSIVILTVSSGGMNEKLGPSLRVFARPAFGIVYKC